MFKHNFAIIFCHTDLYPGAHPESTITTHVVLECSDLVAELVKATSYLSNEIGRNPISTLSRIELHELIHKNVASQAVLVLLHQLRVAGISDPYDYLRRVYNRACSSCSRQQAFTKYRVQENGFNEWCV